MCISWFCWGSARRVFLVPPAIVLEVVFAQSLRFEDPTMLLCPLCLYLDLYSAERFVALHPVSLLSLRVVMALAVQD